RTGNPVEPTLLAQELAGTTCRRAEQHARAAALHDRSLHSLWTVEGAERTYEPAQRGGHASRRHQLQREDAPLAGGDGTLRERQHVAGLTMLARALVDDLQEVGTPGDDRSTDAYALDPERVFLDGGDAGRDVRLLAEVLREHHLETRVARVDRRA